MTGFWVYGQETTGSVISDRLKAAFFQAMNKFPDLQTFARHPRFGHWYREWCSKALGYNCAEASRLGCSCQAKTSFLFNTYPVHAVSITGNKEGRVFKLTERSIERIRAWKVRSPVGRGLVKRSDMFSSNSINGFLKATQSKDDQKANEEIFYKIPLDLKAETNGAKLAARFFPMTQEPFASHDGVLWYPRFNGVTQAELRYRYHVEGRQDTDLFQLLLETELRKAEDTLRAYCKSFRTCDIDSEDRLADPQPIHRFYHERLAVHGTRLLEFYGQGIEVDQSLVPFAKFFSMSISVNGVSYSSLERICQRASHLLDPIRLRSVPTVFGLGDCHGGNVMVSNERNAHSFHELLYIDYEAAGQHSPILDISKPLYNDTIFQTLMGDTLEVPGSFTWSMTEDSIDITIDGCTDDLSKAIFQIKKRYTLTPFVEFSRRHSVDLEDFVPQLGHALFSCAILTRNYASNVDALMRSLGVAVVLSQASTFDDLWARMASLAGKLS